MSAGLASPSGSWLESTSPQRVQDSRPHLHEPPRQRQRSPLVQGRRHLPGARPQLLRQNGDGIGDFTGLIEKLDYLSDLGVSCLWLLPFYPSPLRDDGYDIAHYEGVHPGYGTLKDFRAFLRAAHDGGLQVMTELVINHTSDQHPWFQAARRAPAGSSKRDYYVWSDTRRRYERRARHLHRHRDVQLGVGPGGQRVLLAPLLPSPARPELRQPARPQRRS